LPKTFIHEELSEVLKRYTFGIASPAYLQKRFPV